MHKILIVDDDRSSIEAIKMLLETDYQVDHVPGVQEAHAKLKENSYSVIISDYFMEDGTGIDLLDKYGTSTPVIMITGQAEKNLVKNFLNHHAKFLVEKPLDPDILEEKVKECIATQSQFLQDKKMAFFGEGCAKLMHDLSNAVAIISARANTLNEYAKSLEKPDEYLMKQATSLEKTSERIVSLIKSSKEILTSKQNFSKIERVNLNYLLEQFLFENEPKVDEISGTIQVTCPDLYVKVDEFEFLRIMENLLSNALDALKESGVKNPMIKVDVSLEGERVVIKFKDNGTGVPEAVRSQIFDKTFTTKASGNGSGLGLYICKELIRGFNGDLTLSPATATPGAEFVICLPSSKV